MPDPNSSASSTGSTVSLPLTGEPADQVEVARANDQVYELVRDAMRGELAPIQNQLGKLSSAVEKQGGNIDGLTEMLEGFGVRLESVEAAGDAINQRLARMRAKFQQRLNARPGPSMDQMSELSQEEIYLDANSEADNPAFPSDFTVGAPTPPGLESPAFARLP
jgi:hypothetical protein